MYSQHYKRDWWPFSLFFLNYVSNFITYIYMSNLMVDLNQILNLWNRLTNTIFKIYRRAILFSSFSQNRVHVLKWTPFPVAVWIFHRNLVNRNLRRRAHYLSLKFHHNLINEMLKRLKTYILNIVFIYIFHIDIISYYDKLKLINWLYGTQYISIVCEQ